MNRYGTPRRILMTADTIGGVWTYAIELVREFGKYGIDVALATMGPPLSLDQARAASRLTNLEVFESDFKLEWMQDPWQDVDDAGDWLLYLEQLLKPHIVHLNGFTHGHLPWQAPAIVVAHSCVLSWWKAVNREEAPPEWDIYRDRVAQGLSAAGFVVAPTQWMLTSTETIYGPLKHTRVIHNGRSAANFTTGPKEEIILSAGRLWDQAKNASILGKLAPGVRWPISIAGEQIAAEGVAASDLDFDGLRLLGKLNNEELSAWYSRASIYVLPARYEPFGLTALEAGLSGCALVLGDIPSLREVWGEAAIFVPPDDSELLARAINELIDNPGQRNEMGRKARTRAMQFTSQQMAGSYMDLYSELLTEAALSIAPVQEVGVCA
jgi:glycogen synthase